MSEFTSVFNNITLPNTLKYVERNDKPSGSKPRPQSCFEMNVDPLSASQKGKVKPEDYEATMEKERIVFTPQHGYETVVGYDEVVYGIAKGLSDKNRENPSVGALQPKNTGVTGYLLVGLPGTGKTSLLKAVAARVAKLLKRNVSFFRVTPGLINSCYHGDSEKLIEALFTVADRHPPAILAFDEIDSLCTKRLDNEQTHIRALKNTLLACLQGIKPHPNLVVCGGTNLPDQLDSAFIGRFGMQFLLRPPNPAQRLEILFNEVESYLGDNGYEHEIFNLKSNQRKLHELTEGLTGRDLVLAVMKSVQKITFFQHNGVTILDNQMEKHLREIELSDNPATTIRGVLTMDALVKHGLERLRPTYTSAEYKKVEKYAETYCVNFEENQEAEDEDFVSADRFCLHIPLLCCFNRF